MYSVHGTLYNKEITFHTLLFYLFHNECTYIEYLNEDKHEYQMYLANLQWKLL